MGKLEKTLTLLVTAEMNRDETGSKIDPRALVIVTLIYLCVMLSVSIDRLDTLLWFALYPIIAAPVVGKSFSSVFLKSLWVLPFVIFIGIFNPWINTAPAFKIHSLVISRGWVEFISILLRGLLSMQALLILLAATGFPGMVRALRKLGLPNFLSTQLLMVFRYMTVLLEEAVSMQRARASRGYGAKHLSVRLWGVLIGQLFIRSIDRAERIHRAMMARGFSGSLPSFHAYSSKWNCKDTLWILGWCAIFAVLRFVNLSILFTRF